MNRSSAFSVKSASLLSSPAVGLARSLTRTPSSYPILVHCHLSWDNVWQRPQQFLSRLAKKHPVLFVETHAVDEGTAPSYRYAPAAGATGVTQLKVLFPRKFWDKPGYVDRERRRLVQAALAEPALRKFARPVQWFYDPMAVTAFSGYLDERLTVYDCMDQLAQFRGAPPELVERERQLLGRADVVFCGGKKLHEAKSLLNDNCHFYGCGVDVEHFGSALSKATSLPDDLASLPGPIFGYYGVIDERLDYDLILELAQKTKGSVVMVGPFAKVEVQDLPKHPRLHWLGRRSYEELPRYAKGFDVCLMPFALNEATEFINPTKALEYLGAGRPVVSTAVPDVMALMSDVVHIGYTRPDFISHCMREAASPAQRHQLAGIKLAQANTWEHIVGELEDHIDRAVGREMTKTSSIVKHLQGAPALT